MQMDLPNGKSLETTILNSMKMAGVLHTGRKLCGKRRNCLSQAISPFPKVFSQDLYCQQVKPRACLGKGSTQINNGFW